MTEDRLEGTGDRKWGYANADKDQFDGQTIISGEVIGHLWLLFG